MMIIIIKRENNRETTHKIKLVSDDERVFI